MRIKFERSGGFANIPLNAELDSAEMEPDRAKELKRLVDEARPFDQPSTSKANVPDDLHYRVTIEHAGQSKTINVSDTAAPDELKLLLDFLGEEALNQSRRKP
jgi:emfourin